jgi:hypothetical protein
MDWWLHDASCRRRPDPSRSGLCFDFDSFAFCDGQTSSLRQRALFKKLTRSVWERRQILKRVLRSVLKTAVDLLEQSERISGKMRDRANEGVDCAGNGISQLRRQGRNLYGNEDHTVRNMVSLVAGVSVGISAAVLFAPASGKQVRSSLKDSVQSAGDRIREGISPKRKVGRAQQQQGISR